MCVLGRFECRSFFVRMWMLTVSNALVRSSAVRRVRSGGFGWLNPAEMACAMFWRAVVVEWSGLKPCWCGGMGKCCWSTGRISRSIVFAMGERSEIGLYDVLSVASLFGFGIGMVMAFFQICGMRFVCIDLLMVFVRNCMAMGPRCLRCIIDMLSGPIAGEFLACLIAVVTCWVENGVCSSGVRFFVLRFVLRASGSGVGFWKLRSSALR